MDDTNDLDPTTDVPTTDVAQPRAGRKPRAATPRPRTGTVAEQQAAEPHISPGTPPKRATVPATDAANSDIPLKLSPDAAEGTRDRLTAFKWMEDGEEVRRREDGVYEKLMARPANPRAPVAPQVLQFYPDVELLDRRLLDPGLKNDVTILFKDEAELKPGAQPLYYKRWVDTKIPSRLLTLTQQGGYKQAEWAMLANKSEIGDRDESQKDPYVRRGEKGQYMLLFMPYVKWQQIKMAQADLRTRRERTQMKNLAAGQVASALGPRAAELLTGTDAESGQLNFIGSIRELPPMSLEALQSSGVPKDLASGGVALEDS